MSEVLSSLLSAVKPHPQLANPEVKSAPKFVLDERIASSIMLPEN
jgi:hypothetical protein